MSSLITYRSPGLSERKQYLITKKIHKRQTKLGFDGYKKFTTYLMIYLISSFVSVCIAKLKVGHGWAFHCCCTGVRSNARE